MAKRPAKESAKETESEQPMAVRVFGAKLGEARRAAGFTQTELSRLSGVGQAHISHLEGGNLEPRLSTIMALAAALNIAPADLMPGQEWAQGDAVAERMAKLGVRPERESEAFMVAKRRLSVAENLREREEKAKAMGERLAILFNRSIFKRNFRLFSNARVFIIDGKEIIIDFPVQPRLQRLQYFISRYLGSQHFLKFLFDQLGPESQQISTLSVRVQGREIIDSHKIPKPTFESNPT